MFTQTELQVDMKTAQDEAPKPNPFLKTKFFKCHKTLRITTKSNEKVFNNSGSQLGLLILRLSPEPTKKSNNLRSQNFKQFYDMTLFKAL